MILLFNLNGQTIDFTFDTKDYDGQIIPLDQRLDPDKNYLILFSAFWCHPCVKQLDEIFSKNIDIYRDLYNLEIIILNDEHYDATKIALNKIRDKQWYFQQYMTDNIFGELGINSIPRDYLIYAGDAQGERVYTSSFLSNLESHYIDAGYDSHFFSNNLQKVTSSNCIDIENHNYGITNTEKYIDKEFFNVEGQYYRSGILNKNIYRYNPLTNSESIVFDYYLDKCDQFTLRDQEGDAIQIAIESRRIEDGEIIIETDQMIRNDCGHDIPFVMSSAYGSNAGLVFDIENNEIVSRLICYNQDDELIYIDEELAELCEYVNTKDNELQNHIYLTNNPGNGIFEINGNMTSPIRIFDMKGSQVLFQKKGNEIDISDLSTGIYLVRLESQSIIYIKT
jgi:hypothetical protein